jgi:hypothetical protein
LTRCKSLLDPGLNISVYHVVTPKLRAKSLEIHLLTRIQKQQPSNLLSFLHRSQETPKPSHYNTVSTHDSKSPHAWHSHVKVMIINAEEIEIQRSRDLCKDLDLENPRYPKPLKTQQRSHYALHQLEIK